MKQEIFEAYTSVVCDRFNITEEDLFKKNKSRDVVDARYILYYMCHQRPMRIRYIQQYLKEKGYDIAHSSIIWGIKQITDLVETDSDYKSLIETLKLDALQPR
jgi:chromosomal replication initiation ATPase DnaA